MAFIPPAGDEVTAFAPPDPPLSPNREFVESITRRPIARTFEQGALFGFSDEIEAAGQAVFNRLPGEDFGDAYIRQRDVIRAEVSGFREEHPMAGLGLEIAGGLGTSGVGTGTVVAKASGFVSRVLAGVTSGGITGAIFGAGKAEELEDVPGDAAVSGAFGTAVGAGIPVGASGVRAVASGVQSAFRPVVGATRRLAQALRRDGIKPEQIAQALQEAQTLGKPAVVADLGGSAARRELEVAVQSPGAAAQSAERLFVQRNKDQLARLSKDLVEGTGVKADAVEDVITKTMALRAKAAKPVYEKAMAFQAELNDDIVNAWTSATRTPLGKQALGKARKILNVEDFDKAPLMERIDAFKRGLDDVIGSSKQKGENAIAAKALQVKHSLIESVDNVNPAYKTARQIWESGSNYLDAIDRGREVFKPNFTSARLRQEFSQMADAEQEAFRIGVVDAVVAKMRQQSAKEPNLIKIVRSPEMRDKLKAVMKPDQAKRLDRILDIEDAMSATANQVTKGSQTAQRTAAMAEQQKQVGIMGLMEEISALAITPLRNLVVRGIPSAARRAKDSLLARQNAEIARRLLSSDVDEIFKLPIAEAPRRLEGVLISPAVIAGEQK